MVTIQMVKKAMADPDKVWRDFIDAYEEAQDAAGMMIEYEETDELLYRSALARYKVADDRIRKIIGDGSGSGLAEMLYIAADGEAFVKLLKNCIGRM